VLVVAFSKRNLSCLSRDHNATAETLAASIPLGIGIGREEAVSQGVEQFHNTSFVRSDAGVATVGISHKFSLLDR
jgi:hypothetical protein